MKILTAIIKRHAQRHAWWLTAPLTKPSHCLGLGVVAAALMGMVLTFFYIVSSPADQAFDPSGVGGVVGYIKFHPFRTALYPAFLDLFGGDDLYLHQHLVNLVFVTQAIINVLATGFMLAALAYARLPIVVLVLFLIAILVNYFGLSFHYIIMTESLALSLVYCMIGCLGLWCHSRKFYWLGLAMFCGMLGFGLRPNFLPFPFGIALIAGLHSAVTTPPPPPRKHWVKTVATIIIPLVLVSGFEHVYYFAHHDKRESLLNAHLFGKAAIVLAIHEDEAQDSRFYANGYGDLQPYMQEFGNLFRSTAEYYWQEEEYCMWTDTHTRYESGAYIFGWDGQMTPPDPEWAMRVFSAYPLTLGRVITQYYIQSFCVQYTRLASKRIQPNYYNDMVPVPPTSYSTAEIIVYRLMHWAFILLGLAFFASKAVYGYRWWQRIRAWRFDNISNHEALGSILLILSMGYILFLAIFSSPFVRLFVPSFPLVVLAVLLAMVLMVHGVARKP